MLILLDIYWTENSAKTIYSIYWFTSSTSLIATLVKRVGTGAIKDWESCGMYKNIPHCERGTLEHNECAPFIACLHSSIFSELLQNPGIFRKCLCEIQPVKRCAGASHRHRGFNVWLYASLASNMKKEINWSSHLKNHKSTRSRLWMKRFRESFRGPHQWTSRCLWTRCVFVCRFPLSEFIYSTGLFWESGLWYKNSCIHIRLEKHLEC